MTDDPITIDWQRDERIGHPELVYGEHKTAEQLVAIATQYRDAKRDCLITRCSAEKAAALAGFEGTFDPLGRTWLRWGDEAKPATRGPIAIVSAGTSDSDAVNECATTCALLGITTDVIQDVGVAGIHRLFNRLEAIRQARLVIVAAGFEGALPSVVGGLVSAPVIALPTPVGYGVSAGGHAALNAMLSSCSAGITVVNIGNGCGAALAADRILHMADA